MGRRWQRVEGGAGGTWHFNCWNECRGGEKNCEHSDFRDEENMVEHTLIEKGHIPCFLPE